MSMLYDKRGIPILVGDLVEVYHYTAALRRERCYMYKFVQAQITLGVTKQDYYEMAHLNVKGESYLLHKDDKIHEDFEIIQGFGNDGLHFKERERKG